MLTSCGKSRYDYSITDKAVYADTIINTYGTGRIYGSDPVAYFDYETMESTVLCAKPNCNHLTSECVGKMIGDCPIIYGNHIYYFKYSNRVEDEGNGKRELKIKSQLCRVSRETSEEDVLVTFTDCEPRDYDGWIIYNDKVYFTADDLNPQTDEYGNISISNVGGTHYFCVIDLKTKKYKNFGSVYEGDKQYKGAQYSSSAQIDGLYENKIFINYEYAKEEIVDVHKYGFPEFTEIMFEFDPATDILKQVARPKDINFMNNGTYIYTENNKTIILDHGKQRELDINGGSFASCFNNKLFVRDSNKWYDLSDGSEHSMGKYKDYIVIDLYNDCYILMNHLTTVKLTEEELLALDDD